MLIFTYTQLEILTVIMTEHTDSTVAGTGYPVIPYV